MDNTEKIPASNVFNFPKSQNTNDKILANNDTRLYNKYIGDKLKSSITMNNEEYLASDLEEENTMDNKSTNDILIKYIESLDKKYDDYKRDMVESEKRIYQNAKDSEDRYEKRQEAFDKRLEERLMSIDNKFNKLEEKIDRKFESMESEIKESSKYLKNLTITAIIGIAAMVISIVAIAIGMYFSLLPLLQNIAK